MSKDNGSRPAKDAPKPVAKDTPKPKLPFRVSRPLTPTSTVDRARAALQLSSRVPAGQVFAELLERYERLIGR